MDKLLAPVGRLHHQGLAGMSSVKVSQTLARMGKGHSEGFWVEPTGYIEKPHKEFSQQIIQTKIKING